MLPWAPWGGTAGSWKTEVGAPGPSRCPPPFPSLPPHPVTPHNPASPLRPQPSCLDSGLRGLFLPPGPLPQQQQQARTRHPPAAVHPLRAFLAWPPVPPIGKGRDWFCVDLEHTHGPLSWQSRSGLTWKEEDGWDTMEQAASGPASAPTEGDTPRRIAGEGESGAGSPVCSFVLRQWREQARQWFQPARS